jgi:hypothetical protein
MSKSHFDHSLSAYEFPLHLQSATGKNHDLKYFDDETGNPPELSLDAVSGATHDIFSHTMFDGKNPFSAVGPTVVLYSSDISNPTVHYVPHVVTEAGAGSGSSSSSAGSTGTAPAAIGAASSGLVINVTYDSTVANAPTGFTAVIGQVVQYFESHFNDPVTINITVGYGEAGGYSLGSALGMSLSYLQSTTYSQIKSALGADATTADDSSAVASLSSSDPISSAHNYWISTAEAKALGLNTSTTNTDGFVGFSSTAGIFDYNNSDGVSTNQYDFFGVVAHEFSEVMGRILLVGTTNLNGTPAYDALDLFHFSSSGVHDFSGSTPGYFSINNGATSLNTFNTNASGDAGDWKGDTIDAFNAFGKPSVAEPISQADLTALDVIGWNAASSSSPPPPPPSPADLTVSVVSFHDTTLTLQFSNIGQGAAAASTAGLYLSTDGTITTSDILIATIAIPSLASGASVSGGITVPFPSTLTAGTYHLGVIADYNGQIAESSESNNSAAVSIPVILGNSSPNTLNGTASAEEIVALGSFDTLIGNGGVDTLIGGSGSDHFRYNATTDGGGSGDLIVDFTRGSDVLDFAHTAFGFSTTGTLSSANFVANATGPTNSAQKFWYDTAHFTLYYDANGSAAGGAVAIAQLENHATLNNTNIHLV